MFDNARPISLLLFISKVADKMYCVQGNVCFRKTLFYGAYYRCIGKRKSACIWKKAKLFCQCFPIHPNFWHSRSLYYFQQVHLLRFFSGLALMRIQSYSIHRQQCVAFDGTISAICTFGSVLDSLPFIIYMIYIHIATRQFTFILYTDTTNMISPIPVNSLHKSHRGPSQWPTYATISKMSWIKEGTTEHELIWKWQIRLSNSVWGYSRFCFENMHANDD